MKKKLNKKVLELQEVLENRLDSFVVVGRLKNDPKVVKILLGSPKDLIDCFFTSVVRDPNLATIISEADYKRFNYNLLNVKEIIHGQEDEPSKV